MRKGEEVGGTEGGTCLGVRELVGGDEERKKRKVDFSSSDPAVENIISGPFLLTGLNHCPGWPMSFEGTS